MGFLFKSLNTGLKQKTQTVTNILNASLSLFLYKNIEYSKIIKETFNIVLDKLKKDEIKYQKDLHSMLEDVFNKTFKDVNVVVKISIINLIDSVIDTFIDQIEDGKDILSKEERNAWIYLLSNLIRTCELMERYK